MATSELPLGPVSLQLAAESNDGEKSAGNLGDLLDQVSKNSVGEVDGLIGELRQLRAKPQADGERIKHDIQEYETLSQQGNAIDEDHFRQCGDTLESSDRWAY
jgi:hypothetical protein